MMKENECVGRLRLGRAKLFNITLHYITSHLHWGTPKTIWQNRTI